MPKLDPNINDKCTAQQFCMYSNFHIKLGINNINLIHISSQSHISISMIAYLRKSKNNHGIVFELR